MSNEAWIKIQNSNSHIAATVDDFTEVLADMGITVWNDEEKAEEEGVDLFIRMNRGRDIAIKDILYVLTVSGDLADYYNDDGNERGEGAFEALTPEQQQSIAGAVETALDGFMEDREEAFDIGIENAGI
jgi:hypothetical protein